MEETNVAVVRNVSKKYYQVFRLALVNPFSLPIYWNMTPKPIVYTYVEYMLGPSLMGEYFSLGVTYHVCGFPSNVQYHSACGRKGPILNWLGALKASIGFRRRKKSPLKNVRSSWLDVMCAFHNLRWFSCQGFWRVSLFVWVICRIELNCFASIYFLDSDHDV